MYRTNLFLRLGMFYIFHLKSEYNTGQDQISKIVVELYDCYDFNGSIIFHVITKSYKKADILKFSNLNVRLQQ